MSDLAFFKGFGGIANNLTMIKYALGTVHAFEVEAEY
jgi:hypothetical protein